MRTAWYWRNDYGTPETGFKLGTGTYPSEAYGATSFPDLVGGGRFFIFCGYQYTSSSNYRGVIWKGTSVFHNFDNGTKLYDIAYYDGFFYTVGSAVEGSSIELNVWATDVTNGATSLLYVLSDSMDPSFVDERFSIHIDASGDMYVNGMDDSNDEVWKNGVSLNHPGAWLTSVVANSNGVYVAGGSATVGQIWKDGEVLYTPAYNSSTNSGRITGLFVAAPGCTNGGVRSLPFTDGFENGNTSWPCWTIIDVDNNNGYVASNWMRMGKTGGIPYSGNYCAFHKGCSTNQEGWLITPRLFLQPGQDNTTLTFKSSANQYTSQSVWISTDSDGLNTGSYVEIWSHNGQTSSWETPSIDLKAYQGEAVYIAFKFSCAGSSQPWEWMVDDVSVTEEFEPCSAVTSLPYEADFEGGFENYDCWTAYDGDMSGDQRCWQYYSDIESMGHPYGQSGVPQTGWLFSPRVTLPSGSNSYMLSFKARNDSSGGSGETHTVWIAEDQTGAYSPADYTQIWQ